MSSPKERVFLRGFLGGFSALFEILITRPLRGGVVDRSSPGEGVLCLTKLGGLFLGAVLGGEGGSPALRCLGAAVLPLYRCCINQGSGLATNDGGTNDIVVVGFWGGGVVLRGSMNICPDRNGSCCGLRCLANRNKLIKELYVSRIC